MKPFIKVSCMKPLAVDVAQSAAHPKTSTADLACQTVDFLCQKGSLFGGIDAYLKTSKLIFDVSLRLTRG